MSRLIIITLFALSGIASGRPFENEPQPLLRFLFLDLPVEKDIQDIVKKAEHRKGLNIVDCFGDSYCFQFANHPFFNLNDSDNHFVINGEEHREEFGVKLWIEISEEKNLALLRREFDRLKRIMKKQFIKAGKEKSSRFGEVVQTYKYRIEKGRESSEVHLNWRLSTCKNTLSIIIEYLG